MDTKRGGTTKHIPDSVDDADVLSGWNPKGFDIQDGKQNKLPIEQKLTRKFWPMGKNVVNVCLLSLVKRNI